MTDFLLELRSEEIPARMQDRARADLARLFADMLAEHRVAPGEVVTYATPRRLVLIARGLPDATGAVSEELKGPPADAPDAAIDGFLRKAGLTRDALETREVKGRATLFAVVERPGQPLADVLGSIVPAIVRAFPWPKSMRWGAASLRTESLYWVRPLQGIVALFGDAVVPLAIDGIDSGRTTLGHRFHAPGAIIIDSAATYRDQLRAAHVIVDQDERRAIIRERAAELAAAAGYTLLPDAALVAENAGLTEWPVPLLGTFDPEFLAVPPEVIRLTMATNQKYFSLLAPPLPHAGGASQSPLPQAGGVGGGQADPLLSSTTTLAPAFICVANIEAKDGGAAVIAGNRKVLAARLSDARFFWEQDLKVPLEEQAKKLNHIVFHEKLGTVADKVERVAKLARWLVEEGIVKPRAPAQAGAVPAAAVTSTNRAPAQTGVLSGEAQSSATLLPSQEHDLADLATRAARLCKADLVTGMVGEFPELQGVMGGYYAAAQGEHPAVAAAIRDHYKPVGQGDEVPTDPVTVAVSLADKLDTMLGFFAIDQGPTGSKDPFALRRAALAILGLLTSVPLRLSFNALIGAMTLNRGPLHWIMAAQALHEGKGAGRYFDPTSGSEIADVLSRTRRQTLDFFADRLKVQQREAGVRHDLIDAVFALGNEDDLVRLLARVRALQSFITTDDGVNLLVAYRRAANILKKESTSAPAKAGAVPAAASSPSSLRPAPEHDTAPMADAEDQQIPQTGEEDPLVMVDDPAFTDAVRAVTATTGPTEGTVPEGATAADIALLGALDIAGQQAALAIEAEDFETAMTALAGLRAPIDRFFDAVMVNDPDPDKRAFRLGLLARFRDAVHQVADFSKIEG